MSEVSWLHDRIGATWVSGVVFQPVSHKTCHWHVFLTLAFESHKTGKRVGVRGLRAVRPHRDCVGYLTVSRPVSLKTCHWHVFLTLAFESPSCQKTHRPKRQCVFWRREWDSNPRLLAQHRFSRPALSTAQTSLQGKVSIAKRAPFRQGLVSYRCTLQTL